MSRIVNIDVFNINALTKLKSHISSYKLITAVTMLCFVNKARVLSFIHMCCIGVSYNQDIELV